MPTSWYTTEPTGVGSGWLSGFVSVLCGAVGLGIVLCARFPEWLTVPELRTLYPVPVVRAVLHAVLVVAFLSGLVSLSLRRNKALGLVGTASATLAALIGGTNLQAGDEPTVGPFLGLDWFVLNLVIYCAVFVPIERIWPLRPEQPVFRRSWPTDLVYFFVSALFVQVLTLATLSPAIVLFDWARVPSVQSWMGARPWLFQVGALVVVTDLVQYWVHRAFHAIPALWRFHAVHHSAERMDWLAGSRLHLLDIAATRGLTYVPVYLMGFAEGPLMAYLVLVSAQATFIHANVDVSLGRLGWLVATPHFHHWHHAAEAEAVDRNFAVHLPVIDLLFGTAHRPSRWPSAYGLADGRRAPDGYIRQLVWPIAGRRVE